MNRDQMLTHLEETNKVWDFVIIGGGATGLGAAIDGHRIRDGRQSVAASILGPSDGSPLAVVLKRATTQPGCSTCHANGPAGFGILSRRPSTQ